MIADALLQIQKFQTGSYNLVAVDYIQAYLSFKDIKILDGKEAYELSKIVESGHDNQKFGTFRLRGLTLRGTR